MDEEGNDSREPRRGKKKPSELTEKSKKYERGAANTVKDISDKKLKGGLKRIEKRYREAVTGAARAEILLPSQAGLLEAEGIEKSFHFKQSDIAEAVDVQSAQKAFKLDLKDSGTYKIDYSHNGRFLLLAGRTGHLAVMDWMDSKLSMELQLRQKLRSAKFLNGNAMMVVAQEKDLFIYDQAGTELHCLRNQRPFVTTMEYLPYHWLLVTVGQTGHLRYLDVSTGENVAQIPTKLGRCDVMAQNSTNAIIHLGHHNGVVTLWSPNMHQSLVKLMTHRGGLAAIDVDPSGHYMATTGLDGQLKIWDLRKLDYLQSYFTTQTAHSIHFSQRGLLAVGQGPHVQIWQGMTSTRQHRPYITELCQGQHIDQVRFCPFEDVLGVGHTGGFQSVLCPGAGEPNFDAMEANPYQTKKQRREAEVHSLLEKVPADSITMDVGVIGSVETDHVERSKEIQIAAQAAKDAREGRRKERKKMRGKQKAAKKLKKKQANVMDQKKLELREQMAKKKEEMERKKAEDRDAANKGVISGALTRFT